jgi:serine/threonine protein kinase
MANTLALGSQLNGRYRIQSLVGSGGMGAVYKATDNHLGGRNVALKEMSEDGLSPQEIVEATRAFRQEANLLASLQHPNLPGIHDYFESSGRWYLVMDFIEGQTLEDYLRQYGTPGLPLPEVLRLADQICAVLHYLHSNVPPIIFRDLKPSNMMISGSGRLYLIDFGIARLFKTGQTRDTIALGSPGYAAPEQYGKTQTTAQSDIYSFGATLHQLLTGVDPAVKPFTFPPLLPQNPQIPPDLEALVMSMVQLDASKRPPNVAWIQQELHRRASQLGTPHAAIPSPQALPYSLGIATPSPSHQSYPASPDPQGRHSL